MLYTRIYIYIYMYVLVCAHFLAFEFYKKKTPYHSDVPIKVHKRNETKESNFQVRKITINTLKR